MSDQTNEQAVPAVLTQTAAPQAEPQIEPGAVAPVTGTPAKRKTKGAKATKTAKANKQGKKHKPSDIVRTDANPAKSIVPVRFKEKYAEHGGNNGDVLAGAIQAFLYVKNDDGRTALSLANLKALAEDNGIDFSAYSHLNVGQQSMNVRNRLRGLVKAKKTVVVGKRKFADPAKALAPRPAESQAEQPAA